MTILLIRLMFNVMKMMIKTVDYNEPQVQVNQNKKASLPDIPQRFDPGVGILGTQSFTSGRRYWAVQVRAQKQVNTPN